MASPTRLPSRPSAHIDFAASYQGRAACFESALIPGSIFLREHLLCPLLPWLSEEPGGGRCSPPRREPWLGTQATLGHPRRLVVPLKGAFGWRQLLKEKRQHIAALQLPAKNHFTI